MFETYQYVPIVNTLTLVLSNVNVMRAILSERESEGDIIGGYMDMNHYKNHEFLQRFKHAIRLEIYCDDIEIVNPLGSKTGIHKLCVWYVRIENISAHMNSKNNNIHVLCICCAQDIEKYGYGKILKPFLNDLERLESQEGVVVIINGEEFVPRVTLVAFCGHGLAVHDVYNFLSPAANKFCRMCMISRNDLLKGDIKPKEPRTEELYEQHLNVIENAKNKTEKVKKTVGKNTGIRDKCCLYNSSFFKLSKNKIFDFMHDILLEV